MNEIVRLDRSSGHPSTQEAAPLQSQVEKAFREVFGWIGEDPIPFESHCEHHVAPIIGRAWVAYVPDRRVVGISKLARVVEG